VPAGLSWDSRLRPWTINEKYYPKKKAGKYKEAQKIKKEMHKNKVTARAMKSSRACNRSAVTVHRRRGPNQQ
jgi:hypothetical protein